MGARRRREEEPFGDYREALREEARVERKLLKGKWVWRSFIIDRNEEGQLVGKKIPPYRKPEGG